MIVLRAAVVMSVAFWSCRASAELPILQRATTPDALNSQIDRAREHIRRAGQGHIIVGQVVVEGDDDPRQVISQMRILKDGFFASATRDLKRPVGFRMHQYIPYELDLTPFSGEVVDVGTITMRRLPPIKLAPLRGKIVLEGSDDASAVKIELTSTSGPVNTPTGGTDPRPLAEWGRVRVPVPRSGLVSMDGFTPTYYWCTLSAQGYVSKSMPVQFLPRTGADLGTVTLEKPRRIIIRYIVDRTENGDFDPDETKKILLWGGERWKVTPDIYGWDLEFKQSDGKVSFSSPYGPCYLADLGDAELDEFLDIDESTASKPPRDVPLVSGHVYLMNQRKWDRVVLFRIEVQQLD